MRQPLWKWGYFGLVCGLIAAMAIFLAVYGYLLASD
jgi:hypothetical protein